VRRKETLQCVVHIAETDEQKPSPRPLRKGWGNHRTPALRGKCEVDTCGADFKQAGIRRHVDHIVPARLIRRLNAGNPDRRENLQCICGTCHGYKLQADHKLCLGDKLGYLKILRTHNFDLARAERALHVPCLRTGRTICSANISARKAMKATPQRLTSVSLSTIRPLNQSQHDDNLSI